MRWFRIWLFSTILAVGLLTAPVALPSVAAEPPVALAVSPQAPMPAEQFSVTGTLKTAVARPVFLQWKSGSTWKQLATSVTTSNGAFSFVSATSKSSLTVRVVASSVTVDAETLARVVTRSVKIQTVGQRGSLSIPSKAVRGWPVDVGVRFSPAREGRPIALQQKMAGKWITVARNTTVWNGRAGLNFTPTTTGRVAYRAYAPAWHGAPAVGSGVKIVKVAAGIAKRPAVAVTTGARGYGGCAITATGGVECWGTNYWGELGRGAAKDAFEATVKVKGLSRGVTAIASGNDFSCALTTAGAVKCWGRNQWGKLGDGSTRDRYAPVQVKGLTRGVVAITAGFGHACALTASGGVKCWGALAGWDIEQESENPAYHFFGHIPVDVPGLTTGVVAIDAGDFHNCALTLDKVVKCWGYNSDGQVGVAPAASAVDRYVAEPVVVAGVGDAASVSAGNDHSCARTVAGVVKCWGSNKSGQLGDGTVVDSSTPVQVTGLAGAATTVSAGYASTCAISAGVVTCWGLRFGTGIGPEYLAGASLTPVVVKLPPGDVIALSVGAGSYAVTRSGQVFGWGKTAKAVPEFG